MNKFKKAAVFAAAIAVTVVLYGSQAFAADYKVAKDDSLFKIGSLFGTTVGTLKSDNNLKTDMIYPGQILKVRAAAYTVKSGDTLYLIAKKHGIGLASLRKANAKWDDAIYPGQTLILPGTAPSSEGGSNSAGSSAASGSAKAVVPFTASDVDLLARLINAEAANQPYEAMVAVGAVVINRVQSDDWADSIRDVVYEVSGGYYQFSPVQNGYINKPATDISVKAAYAALYGSDPSNGAMFYFDDSATNKWLWSKPQTAYIGNMVFVI